MINESFDLGLVAFIALLLLPVFFVIFGQVTVRKLRKNSKTKDALGMEVVSGSNIFGVSQTFSIPRRWAKKLDEKNLAFGGAIVANSDLLYEHTNMFDRFLARLLYWWFWFSLITMFIAIAIES